MSAIPEEWIKQYVDKLLTLAGRFDSGPMRDAAAMRADHVMDMVKAWRESQQVNRQTEPRAHLPPPGYRPLPMPSCDAEDAARYRWLKANHLQTGKDSWIRTGDDLEEAIDEGRRAENRT